MSLRIRWKRLHWGWKALIYLHLLAVVLIVGAWWAVEHARSKAALVISDLSSRINVAPTSAKGLDISPDARHERSQSSLHFDGFEWREDGFPFVVLFRMHSIDNNLTLKGRCRYQFFSDSIEVEDLEVRLAYTDNSGLGLSKASGSVQILHGKILVPFPKK